MTSTATSLVLRHVNRILLSSIEERLTLGAICHRDYDRGARCHGDTVLVQVDPVDPGRDPANFRLRLETVEFLLPDVTNALLTPAILEQQCMGALDTLCSCIERELLSCLSRFRSCVSLPHTGISRIALDEADQILFDAGSGGSPLHLVTSEYGWRQLQSEGASQVSFMETCSPSPEDEPWLRTNAVLTSRALCLVTRRLVQTSSEPTAYAESDTIGFTITARDGADPKSAYIGIHLLFAADILRDELGVRVPIPADGLVSAPNTTPSSPAPAPAQLSIPAGGARLVDPCSGDALAALKQAAANPVVARFQTTLDSLSDTIPDPASRLSTALRLVARTDNITAGELLTCCTAQFNSLSSANDVFASYMDGRRREEIDTRSGLVREIDQAVSMLRCKLEELAGERIRLNAEMEEQESRLRVREEDFAAAMSEVWDGVVGMETLLRLP